MSHRCVTDVRFTPSFLTIRLQTSETSHVVQEYIRKDKTGEWNAMYSRVIRKWCLEMLRKPLEIVSKFLKFGIGHSATASGKQTAWGRSWRRPWRPDGELLGDPRKTVRAKMSLTLGTTSLEHHRFDATRDALLIPAW